MKKRVCGGTHILDDWDGKDDYMMEELGFFRFWYEIWDVKKSGKRPNSEVFQRLSAFHSPVLPVLTCATNWREKLYLLGAPRPGPRPANETGKGSGSWSSTLGPSQWGTKEFYLKDLDLQTDSWALTFVGKLTIFRFWVNPRFSRGSWKWIQSFHVGFEIRTRPIAPKSIYVGPPLGPPFKIWATQTHILLKAKFVPLEDWAYN